MKNKELDCEIVRDLLPLYHDDVVSATTKEAVAAHLETCQPCREEYETLCTELPEETKAPSTKERFTALMRNQKRKRFWGGVVSAVLVLALLVGGYFAQSQWMCVTIPSDKIQVHKVFRYQMDDGYHFFLWYNAPAYKQNRASMFVEHRPEGDVLVVQEKRAPIAKTVAVNGAGDKFHDMIYCSNEGFAVQPPLLPKMTESRPAVPDEIKNAQYPVYDTQTTARPYIVAVEVNGKTVWTEAEDGDTPVPDYVYAWDAFDRAHEKISMAVHDAELGQIGVETIEGRRIIWDLDGNVILDTQAAENKK